jgi:H+-transporting ATPase
MNSYAIYRIAETLRVLLFMTLAILVFNFYPLTAVMIVMLALLNDGAILSIAYDNVHYKDQPEAWNMPVVLGIATVLGIIGVVAAFGLFYLGERVFHLDRAHIQTLMYLKLSVAGHLTIFLTRTRGPFWSIRPARILWIAVLGTQIVATLIAVYGVFMTPLGWGWAGFVWGYALAWFLVNDRVKLLAYRIFDPVRAAPQIKAKAAPQPEAKAQPKPEVKAAEPEPDGKAERKPETKAAPQPEAKTAPQPEAKSDAKAEPNPDAKAEPKVETKAAPQPEAKAEAKPEANTGVATLMDTKLGDVLLAGLAKDPESVGRIVAAAITQAEASIAATKAPEAEPQPDARAAPQPEAKAEPKPEAKAQPDPKAELKPDAEAKTPPD